MSSIVEKLSSFPITGDSDFGFDAHFLDEKSLCCTYFQKEMEKQVVSLPNGETLESQTVKLVVFDFDLHYLKDGEFLACIKCPPRSLRGFVSNLSTVLGEVFISSLTINVLDFIHEVKSMPMISQFKLTEISAGSIILGEESFGDLKIKSLKNAYSVFDEHFGNFQYTTKSAKFDFVLEGKKYFGKISKSGSLDTNVSFLEKAVNIFRNLI
jgi:hypothetical protein